MIPSHSAARRTGFSFGHLHPRRIGTRGVCTGASGSHRVLDYVFRRREGIGVKCLAWSRPAIPFDVSALTESLAEDGRIVEWLGQWEFARMLDLVGGS
jgi:hypothetical protein